MGINVKIDVAVICKVTTAVTNKSKCTYITCVHICAKFELTTTKTLTCMTVYRYTTIWNPIGNDVAKPTQSIMAVTNVLIYC